MLHDNRTYRIRVCQSFEEVAADLKNHYSHLLCAGYQVGDVLILNDSTNEDALIEFAVLVMPPAAPCPIDTEMIVTAHQTESITVSWCSADELIEHFRGASTRSSFSDGWFGRRPITLQLDFSPDHRCGFCR